MLKRLHLRNFTVFEDADFEFGPGLNVIVGANGTGKSHVLKAGYATLYNFLTRVREVEKNASLWGKPYEWPLERPYHLFLENKLKDVFQPTPLDSKELIRRDIDTDRTVIGASFEYSGEQIDSSIILTNNKAYEGAIQSSIGFKIGPPILSPVFIPAKEALTMGWLLPLYDRREIPIDETYPDLLRLLMGPPLRQPEPAHIVAQLQQLIGGKVEEEGGRFYLAGQEQPRMEMNLVAEGVRKFATLYKLLANGTLTPETTLFWDEPEANLNPALLKEMAAVLTALARAGFQIILATHSLFLLKELHILAQRERQPVRYFALYAGENGATQVETKDDFIQLEHVAALDAELTQTFDFEAALDDEYAGDS